MNEKDKGPAGTDSVTAATEKDVQPDVTADVERLIGWHLLHPGLPPNKSEFQALEDSLPAPFISLHDVLEAVACANSRTYREAAHLLLVKLESEDDFPAWYRRTSAKSRGELDTQNGADWGKKLLRHAESRGEPVTFPHIVYDDYDLPSMPSISVYHFLCFGPTLGFQINEIGPFLTRHGIKGFAEHRLVAAEAGSHATPTENNPKSRGGTEDAAPKPVYATPQEPKTDTARAHGSTPSLNGDQRAEIVRRMRTERQSVARLARDFGVSRPTIDKILVEVGMKIKKKKGT